MPSFFFGRFSTLSLFLPLGLTGLFFFFNLTACQAPSQEKWRNETDFVKVKLPFTTPHGVGFQIVELTTLRNMTELEGEAARFYINSNFLKDKSQIVGTSPSINIARTNLGYYVAKDPFSIQLLFIYYTFEKLKMWDRTLGIESLQTWPRTIVVFPSSNKELKTEEPNRQKLYDNALYNGTYDIYFIQPYLSNLVPLSLNGGVLAHEHFHSHFYKRVLSPLGMSETELRKGFNELPPREKYHRVLFRAINEGLADIWGYLYSHDPQFLNKSLVQPQRSLTLPDFNLPSTIQISSLFQPTNPTPIKGANPTPITGTNPTPTIETFSKTYQQVEPFDVECLTYSLATEFAKNLYSLIQPPTKEAQPLISDHDFAKKILELLPILVEKFKSLPSDSLLDAQILLTILKEILPSPMKETIKVSTHSFVLNKLQTSCTPPAPVIRIFTELDKSGGKK